ncbi:MAG: DUF3467 domain-containing protein [Patescibacteria group bacterium]
MSKKPYESFGKELKKIREDAKKSLLDVSGAMELDPEQLRRIEIGEERPTEELIILLVSHFELEDSDALELWKLAGYDRPDIDKETTGSTAGTPVVIPINDARVVYTDMVNVSANNYGVVVNFMQGLGANNQQMTISRVGMSVEHAVSLIKVLSETVEQVLEKKTEEPKSITDKSQSSKSKESGKTDAQDTGN